MKRGFLLAALQLGIVLLTGAKYLVDRSTLPRAWARVRPFDPNLPIRGRYVRLALEVKLEDSAPSGAAVKLLAKDSELQAIATTEDTGNHLGWRLDGARGQLLAEPVAFFIPEHIPDPSRRAVGEELWAEVTIPRTGPPRPIRLAVKKDGAFTILGID
jgi:hypothetical protein